MSQSPHDVRTLTALGAAFAGGTGGRYPYLKSFYPAGVQAVDGTAANAARDDSQADLVMLPRRLQPRRVGKAAHGKSGVHELPEEPVALSVIVIGPGATQVQPDRHDSVQNDLGMDSPLH